MSERDYVDSILICLHSVFVITGNCELALVQSQMDRDLKLTQSLQGSQQYALLLWAFSPQHNKCALSRVETCPEKLIASGVPLTNAVWANKALSLQLLQMIGFHFIRCFHCILKASADAKQHGPAIPVQYCMCKQMSIQGNLTLSLPRVSRFH